MGGTFGTVYNANSVKSVSSVQRGATSISDGIFLSVGYLYIGHSIGVLRVGHFIAEYSILVFHPRHVLLCQ